MVEEFDVFLDLARLIRGPRHNQIRRKLLAKQGELPIDVFAEGVNLFAGTHLHGARDRAMRLPSAGGVAHGVRVKISRRILIAARDRYEVAKIQRRTGCRLANNYVSDVLFASELA